MRRSEQCYDKWSEPVPAASISHFNWHLFLKKNCDIHTSIINDKNTKQIAKQTKELKNSNSTLRTEAIITKGLHLKWNLGYTSSNALDSPLTQASKSFTIIIKKAFINWTNIF